MSAKIKLTNSQEKALSALVKKEQANGATWKNILARVNADKKIGVKFKEKTLKSRVKEIQQEKIDS